jgi:hypothetical protein
MAYTAKDFHEDLAIFSAGALLGPARTRKMLAFAARKGISLVGLGARTAALPVARAATSPVGAGAVLGGVALQTPQGQELLEMAAERGRQDRIRLERLIQDIQTPDRAYGAQPPFQAISPRRAAKRTVSKFNKAVSKGMKIVKASTSFGKKGKINNAKRAFSTVTKVVSLKKKKKKAPRSGIRAKIYHGIKGIL